MGYLWQSWCVTMINEINKIQNISYNTSHIWFGSLLAKLYPSYIETSMVQGNINITLSSLSSMHHCILLIMWANVSLKQHYEHRFTLGCIHLRGHPLFCFSVRTEQNTNWEQRMTVLNLTIFMGTRAAWQFWIWLHCGIFFWLDIEYFWKCVSYNWTVCWKSGLKWRQVWYTVSYMGNKLYITYWTGSYSSWFAKHVFLHDALIIMSMKCW